MTFAVLRRLSELHEPSRACIWKRIRQVLAVDWELAPRKENGRAADPDIARARDFFSTKGGLGGAGMRFRHFVSQVLEDLLVLDAVALYRRRNRAGGIHSIEIVDPATIRPLRDERGYLPVPPAPAYEQWAEGRKVGEWTTDELRYEMMNPRSCSTYGLSPLECLVATVEGSLRA